jgi:magnesium/cobalt transport protein CorA
MGRALLFEQDAVEEVRDWPDRLPEIPASSVLWIDLESPADDELEQLAGALDLSRRSVQLLRDRQHETPCFQDFESYLHVSAQAPVGFGELTVLACLVGEHWVVTIRDRPLEILETFRERASGSGNTGGLEGLEFLANLLEWVFESYFDAFEEIEVVLEEIEANAMSGDIDGSPDVLGRLVEVRHEVGRLRRALSSHREAILALSRPELDAISSSASADRYAALRDRLEAAIDAARDSRESVVGSFDVLLATTGQRTNDIMKVLTLASVLILPGSLLAGIMGMNFRLGFFTDPLYFWVVVAAMAIVAVATLAIARMRDWI